MSAANAYLDARVEMKTNVSLSLKKKTSPIVAHLALTRPRERGAEVAVSGGAVPLS